MPMKYFISGETNTDTALIPLLFTTFSFCTVLDALALAMEVRLGAFFLYTPSPPKIHKFTPDCEQRKLEKCLARQPAYFPLFSLNKKTLFRSCQDEKEKIIT